jgi:hypothetical protein
MFAAITGLIAVYFNYNLSAQEQMKFDKERSQEKILFSQMELDEELVNISNITIANAGTIEVRIRALYVEKNGTTTFISDPSTYMDTHIPPAKSLTINVQPTTPFEEANIIAATERGTKTIEYEPQLLCRPDEYKVSPSELTIGPVLLKFTDFYWRKTKNGGLDPGDTWHDGWVIPSKTQCAWKLTVKNVDNRTSSITLNNYTSFNVQTADGQREVRNWYLSTPSQELPFNQTVSVIFMFESWNSNKLVSIYPNECSCKIFLTCYGVFHWADGKPDTPYAQTIPFEAIFVTK